MRIRVISWLMSVFLSAFPLPSLRSRVSLLCPLLLLSCSPSTDSDSTNNGTVERERISVSGSISEDAVWEIGGGRPENGRPADQETGGKSSDSGFISMSKKIHYRNDLRKQG